MAKMSQKTSKQMSVNQTDEIKNSIFRYLNIREHSKSRSLHIQTHTNGSGKTADWWNFQKFDIENSLKIVIPLQ